jgi:hypothetical protein
MSTISRQRSYLRRGSRGLGRGGASAAARIPTRGPSVALPIEAPPQSLVTMQERESAEPLFFNPAGEAPRNLPVMGHSSPIRSRPASAVNGHAPEGEVSAFADAHSMAAPPSKGEETAELQNRVVSLEGEVDSLRVDIRLLQQENSQCHEDIVGLRITLEELIQVLLREIVDLVERVEKKMKTKKSLQPLGDVCNKVIYFSYPLLPTADMPLA